uniref:Endonuclease/exonuclease/phosphatase domain-containing protein n=1 Tax=Glossina brevipalpis TaxID=37001 RepID=A0A1A9WPF3_9MUSC
MEIALKNVTETHKGFELCRLNAQNFNKSKIDYFNCLLSALPIDIICITKTWFNPHINVRFCEISGFNVVRHDRTYSTRGGDIAFYIKQNLNSKIVLKSGHDSIVEYLGVEISGNNSKCLIMCVYNPHMCYRVDDVFSALDEISVAYENIVLCGDFNVDLLLNDHATYMKPTQFESEDLN